MPKPSRSREPRSGSPRRRLKPGERHQGHHLPSGTCRTFQKSSSCGPLLHASVPADTIVEVTSLYLPKALLEIEAIAVADEAVEQREAEKEQTSREFVVYYRRKCLRKTIGVIGMRAAEKLGFDPRRAMTLIGVASLAMPEFLIEVEAVAVVD